MSKPYNTTGNYSKDEDGTDQKVYSFLVKERLKTEAKLQKARTLIKTNQKEKASQAVFDFKMELNVLVGSYIHKFEKRKDVEVPDGIDTDDYFVDDLNFEKCITIFNEVKNLQESLGHFGAESDNVKEEEVG